MLGESCPSVMGGVTLSGVRCHCPLLTSSVICPIRSPWYHHRPRCNRDSSSPSLRVTPRPLLACPSSAETSAGVSISLPPLILLHLLRYAPLWGRQRHPRISELWEAEQVTSPLEGKSPSHRHGRAFPVRPCPPVCLGRERAGPLCSQVLTRQREFYRVLPWTRCPGPRAREGRGPATASASHPALSTGQRTCSDLRPSKSKASRFQAQT